MNLLTTSSTRSVFFFGDSNDIPLRWVVAATFKFAIYGVSSCVRPCSNTIFLVYKIEFLTATLSKWPTVCVILFPGFKIDLNEMPEKTEMRLSLVELWIRGKS